MKHRLAWIAIFVVAAIGVVAFVVAGSSGGGGTPTERLSSWVTSSALGQHLGTITGDGKDIDEVLAQHHGTGALHTDCDLLATDAGTAENQLPAPDTTITAWLNKAYSLAYRAGEACYGTSATDTSALRADASERSQASVLMGRVLVRVEALTGKTVSTTTTTQPTTGGSIFG
jgi:hypothetical protein